MSSPPNTQLQSSSRSLLALFFLIGWHFCRFSHMNVFVLPNMCVYRQVEAEAQPDISEKFEIVAVPTFVFVQVRLACFPSLLTPRPTDLLISFLCLSFNCLLIPWCVCVCVWRCRMGRLSTEWREPMLLSSARRSQNTPSPQPPLQWEQEPQQHSSQTRRL